MNPNSGQGGKSGSSGIMKTAFLSVWKYRKESFALAVSLLFVEAIVVALAFLSPLTLIISVPLILLPFLFAMQMSLSSYEGGAGLSNRSFFNYFGLYFSPSQPFYGVYRYWVSFLKAVGIGFLSFFIVGLTYSSIASSFDPSFASAINELYALLMSETATQQDLTSLLTGSASLIIYENVAFLSGFGFGGYYFVHCFGIDCLNPYIRATSGGMPPRMANSIFTNGLRYLRNKIYPEYYRGVYLLLILGIVGYGGGIGLALLFSAEPSVLLVGGLSGFFLLTFPLIPYFFKVMELLADFTMDDFLDVSLKMAEDSLRQMKQENQLSQQQIDQMEEDLKKAKEKLDDKKNGTPEDDKGDDDADKPDEGSDKKE